jgi:dihydroorotate dehydrogenase electron transfer subunit
LYRDLAPIITNQEVMPGVFLLKLKSARIASDAGPGQFVMIKSDSGQERLLRRPISLHNVIDNELHLLYAVIGEGTRWLSQQPSGGKLDILGPSGNGFTIDAGARNLVLAAGGMGIAPFKFLAARAVSQGRRVKLLVGAKTASLLLPTVALPAGIEYLTATEDGSQGEKGLVTGLIQEHSAWADQIFICGPLPMYRAIVKNAVNLLNGKPTQVSLEVRMGCGMGICYSCTVKTTRGLKKVCQDGPVFDIGEVDWEWLK